MDPDSGRSTGAWCSISPMHGVRVDPVAGTARVEGGATLGDVHHATLPFDLALPSGIISTTGVGGITLGGGLGHLTRQMGLTIDKLARGRTSFSPMAPSSLPMRVPAPRSVLGVAGWAAVTSGWVATLFLFHLQPLPNLYAGPMLWDLDCSAEVLRWYRDFITQAPDDLNGFFAFLTRSRRGALPRRRALGTQKMCGVVWAYTGDDPEATFAPIPCPSSVLRPWIGWVRSPTPRSTACVDGHLPGWRSVVLEGGLRQGDSGGGGGYPRQIRRDAADREIDDAPSTRSMESASRVAGDATAWDYRDAKWGMVMVGVSPDPADNEHMIDWTRNYWRALHP